MARRRAKRRVVIQKYDININDDDWADYTDQEMGYGIPSLINHVAIYFLQQSMTLTDVQSFYRHYEKMELKTITGRPQKNWKVLAKDWIYHTIQNAKLMKRLEVKRSAFPDT